ncbi:unnamed protein product, partial [Staurois parvus]
CRLLLQIFVKEWVALRTSVNSSVVIKSIREISLLLNIPWSTVSGIITKWKQLGTIATQPQSGRPCKMTERGQLSAESIAKNLQTSCGLQISTTTERA